MIKNIDTTAADLKAKMNAQFDDFIKDFSKGTDNPDFDINDIEKLMVAFDKKSKELLIKMTNRLASDVDVRKKGAVPSAMRLSD